MNAAQVITTIIANIAVVAGVIVGVIQLFKVVHATKAGHERQKK